MDLRDNNPQKKWKNREFTASFEFALTGIITAFKEERNMRKHLVSAILVVLAGLIFRVSATEWGRAPHRPARLKPRPPGHRPGLPPDGVGGQRP